jgi:ABC-type xylose transport system permease subunit
MRYLMPMLLILIGGIIGLVGDYPINSLTYRSFGLMVFGGLMVAAGIVWLLISSARHNSRADEPEGNIRP